MPILQLSHVCLVIYFEHKPDPFVRLGPSSKHKLKGKKVCTEAELSIQQQQTFLTVPG